MALYKEITANNGAIAYYHRISNVNKNFTEVNVTLNCYASQEYRDKEKYIFEIIQNYDEKANRYSQLLDMVETDMTEEELAERDTLKQEMNDYAEYMSLGHYSLFNINAKLDWDDNEDVSFANIYDRLKESDELLKGATDC